MRGEATSGAHEVIDVVLRRDLNRRLQRGWLVEQ